jgi:Leucine-rich repeat (LRR) protein
MLAIFLCLVLIALPINISSEVIEPSTGSIECLYNPGPPVWCILQLQNPNGLDNFTSIAGQLPQNTSNFDVQDLTSVLQNSPIIPSIICRTFPNLERFSIAASGIQRLTPFAFENCRNLLNLWLQLNEINQIADFTFQNLVNLRTLDLDSNRIASLTSNTFSGLTSSMELLNLRENLLQTLPNNMLPNFNVARIDVGRNNLTSILFATFGNSIHGIEAFIADNNLINELDALWFDRAVALQTLILRGNLCSNQDFFNVAADRQFVRANLTACINNFDQGTTTTTGELIRVSEN